ncbi:MAG: 3-dehydroquinate synthase [Rhodovarius sp.]|nr:3-dehydroquinate synthase [Rhodovarius sp.]
MPTNPAPSPGRAGAIVLVGMPGAGKTSIGRRLAVRLGLPFVDADAEIEAAAGLPITEIFARYGEAHFRDGERRVIARLLAGPPLVLATGGGAFADPATRAVIKAAPCTTVWLRCPLPVLLRRVAGREHRPMFLNQDPAAVLERLAAARYPFFAEADVIVDCTDETPEATTRRVEQALLSYRPPARLQVALSRHSYGIAIGPGLLARAGAELADILPARRCVVVADAAVAPLHLPRLCDGLSAAGFAILAEFAVPSGEASKSFAEYQRLAEGMLAARVDRRTAVIALGGGVIGDLAGFAAATVLRGLPLVQCPTTLLSQVDSSVGGKTGINTPQGKNLIGAFHQPRAVLADTDVLSTLPERELRAGWAEVAKHGLIQGPLWEWCEAHGPAAIAGDAEALTHAVRESCRLKAAIVAGDEFEEAPEGGRALLNLGHTFGHALEAEAGFDGSLLHGEAVAIGLGLAAMLSVRLGLCAAHWPERVTAHLRAIGLPARLRDLPRRFSAARLVERMRADKKARAGALRFVLLHEAGDCRTVEGVEEALVRDLLEEEGCAA